MVEVIVNADTKGEALRKASKKAFYEGGMVRPIPAVATRARKHPMREGKFIVNIRKDRRY